MDQQGISYRPNGRLRASSWPTGQSPAPKQSMGQDLSGGKDAEKGPFFTTSQEYHSKPRGDLSFFRARGHLPSSFSKRRLIAKILPLLIPSRNASVVLTRCLNMQTSGYTGCATASQCGASSYRPSQHAPTYLTGKPRFVCPVIGWRNPYFRSGAKLPTNISIPFPAGR